jgi:predicted transcriptional regulator
VRYECVAELSTQTRQKRTRFDTIYEILQLCTETTKRTHIMFRINLSYAQLEKFLSLLVHSGLLSVSNQGYTTNEKGRHFMEVYTELLSIFEGF